MDEHKNTIEPKQICSIEIMFPVESDEQAIVYKKKIREALSDRPEARFKFSLSNMSR